MNNKVPDQVTFKTGQEESEGGFIAVVRTVSVIVLIVGAAGSLLFMFRAGQQTPRLLLILFTLWVLAPFAALFWATMTSKRWPSVTRGTLYGVSLIVALSSLAIYSELIDIKPVGSANAFLYVIVPPLSLILGAIAVLIAALISGRRSRRENGS